MSNLVKANIGGGVGLQVQRQSFHTAGRFWTFWEDSGANGAYFSSSIDGTIWAARTQFSVYGGFSDVIGRKLSVAYRAPYVHVVYAYNGGGFNSDLRYRRGTPQLNGTIVWTAEQLVGVAMNDMPFIAVDTNGFAWVSCSVINALQLDSRTYKNSMTDGTWITDVGFPYTIQTLGGTFNTVILVPLTNGNMMAIVTNDNLQTARSRRWTAGVWGAEKATTKIPFWAYMASAVAIGDDVHLVFETGPGGNPLWHTINSASSDTWSAEVQLHPNLNTEGWAILSSDESRNDVHVFYNVSQFHVNTPNIYHATWNSSIWSSVELFQWESPNVVTRANAYDRILDGYIGVAFTENLGPVDIKHAFLYQPIPVVTTNIGFEFGLTPALGTIIPFGVGTTGLNFQQLLSGLSSGTMYYFRAYATSGAGSTVGTTLSFTTILGGISIQLHANTPTEVTENQGRVHGTIIEDGDGYVNIRFNYGGDRNYGQNTQWIVNKHKGDTVDELLTNLSPGKSTHYRLEGVGQAGHAFSNDQAINTFDLDSALMFVAEQDLHILLE